jgi:hypothetical protein
VMRGQTEAPLSPSSGFLEEKKLVAQRIAWEANCCTGGRYLHPSKRQGQESTECLAPLLISSTRGLE